MNEQQKNDLIQLCLDIQAHAEIDSEITLCGNGVCSSEASVVARRILEILNTKLNEDDLNNRVKELEKEYGY